eukprot:NODE_1060_length_2390_cov_0.245744.p1 type:complete len:263 gc:universal NODE_1060_length_2390_cov_0.245744:533-1321(+)
MFEFQIRIDFDSEFVWVKGHPIRMNRSDDESAIHTNVINYIHSKRPNPFKFQHLQKNSSHEYDEFTKDIIVPEYKDSNNTPEHLNINPELAERTALLQMASKFLTLFGKETTSRVKIRDHIRTEVTKPVRAGIPKLSQTEIVIVKEEVQKMLENGIIEPPDSDWKAAVVLIPKPDGQVRFCVNYKPFNKHTKFDAYPLPNLQALLHSLHGARYFIVLDLKSGYCQIKVEEEDKEKTAFVTPFGLYQFLVMPFGLSTAPTTFQ